jgi:hypothetical protein
MGGEGGGRWPARPSVGRHGLASSRPGRGKAFTALLAVAPRPGRGGAVLALVAAVAGSFFLVPPAPTQGAVAPGPAPAQGALAPALAAQQADSSAALANPATNIPRTAVIERECGNPSSNACQAAVVEAIDSARAAEGVKPLQLPSYYESLSVPQQLLVLADAEREDRGLPGFAGLSSRLDAIAREGALSNNDPNGPANTSWGSNWAGGEGSALLADYDWMYDDGPGSPNLDCAKPGASGCWDHRLNILGDYGPHPSMGAAVASVSGVSSFTELFSSGAPGPLDYVLPATAPSLSGGPAAHPAKVQPSTGDGAPSYWQATSTGAIFAAGDQGLHGSAARLHLARPVVGIAATPNGRGYWEVAADGGVFSFGNAKFYGSAARRRLPSPVVGMAVARGGLGYWLATSDGSVYSFGEAKFYGSLAGKAGRQVVGIAPTADGHGYWLVTARGSIYNFGDARPYGPRGHLATSSPVVGIAATPAGAGYWLVTRRGNVFCFGDAKYYGTPAGVAGDDVVSIAVPPSGDGYYVATASGKVFSFGAPQVSRAPRALSEPHALPSAPVVAITTPGT